MNLNMTSPRTTVSGIATILIAIATAVKALFDGDPATNPDWALVVTTVISGIGLLAARDNKVTSEQAGAK